MTNSEIATILRNVAAAYAIKNDAQYRFKIIAYQKAADAVENFATEIQDLIKDGKAIDLPGIGKSIQDHLEELIKTGHVKHFENLMKDIPKAVFPLLNIPSFGPKKAYKIVSYFNLNNPDTVIEDVEKLAREGKIAQIEGFGEKSQQDIIEAIEDYKMGASKTARMVLPYATELAEKVLSYLKKSPDVIEAQPLGSLRRKKETIGDIDIAVATRYPQKVIDYFVKYPYKERILEKGEATASILVSGGKHIDLMVQPPESFGSLLQHFTGSKQHNIHLREFAISKGLSLSEYGIKKKTNGEKLIKFANEKDFYNAIGLDWIPPEIREDQGEIEFASKHSLPKLVEVSDIKGDFHIHSSYPIEPSHDMGQNSMEEMIEKAKSLNYQYIGFSEHNPSISKHSQKEIYQILIKRNKYIEQIKVYNKNIRIFSLLETDILPNGDLAISDESLNLLDATLVSIHSGFSMSKLEMTKRVLKGLSHPKAKILSHPTGRLLNQRAGYDLEWDEVFAFCKEYNKALEINSWPLRLDLPDVLVKIGKEKGVKFVINTDSHSKDQMDLIRYGVYVARRGWLTKDDIINTQEYNNVELWFKQ
ncbi:MAG: DNA polymerase/3'-5' exonuclease PolX [Patescibacteria group bacterium]|nr:MAG: DNA polymerase/3'-5' exonuclease PolX [Patescibacteria group bacterium]